MYQNQPQAYACDPGTDDIPVTLPGNYNLEINSSPVAGVTLNIEAGSAENSLTATINGLLLVSEQAAITSPMSLNGNFTFHRQQSSANEDFYLFILQGQGSITDINSNSSFPGAFSLCGFLVTDSSPATLRTQYATAYEFSGNAENIGGDIAVWVKQSQ